MWLVRRLDVQLSVGSAWTIDRTRLAVARAVTAAVQRSVIEVDDRVNVLWFPDQASFLARFFGDVADGRTIDRWEYRHLLEGRQSGSAVIASECTRSPSTSLDALRQMSAKQRFAVVDTLCPEDASAALLALASTADDGDRKGFLALVDAMTELSESSRLPNHPNGAALAIFVSAVCSRRLPPSAWTANRAAEAAALVDVLRNARTDQRDDIADAIVRGAWSALAGDQLTELAGLATWPGDLRSAAVAAALPGRDPSAASVPEEGDLWTRLGGIFLLLPIVDEVLLDPISTWPDLNGTSPRRVVRFLMTVSALGAPRNAAAATDAVLRRAVGIPTQLTSNEVSQWINGRSAEELDMLLAGVGSLLRRHDIWHDVWHDVMPSSVEDERYAAVGPPFELTPHATSVLGRAGAAVVRVLATRLPGLAKSSLSYMWTNILDFDATVTIGETHNVVSVSDPPLHLLLSMAGLSQRRIVLENGEGHEWVLTRAS